MSRPLFLVVAISLCAACNQSTSPSEQYSNLISNLSVKQLGLTHQVCNWAWDYSVHDEVTFDVNGRSGDSLVGHRVVQLVGNERVTLGTINRCGSAVTPCTASTSACVTASTTNSGTVRVYRRVSWTPSYEWKLLVSGDIDSNLLTRVVQRPEGLPSGDRASIMHIDASKNHPFYSYVIIAYSPGVPGRRIRLTREMWSNGVRFSQLTWEEAEITGDPLVVSTGAANWPAGPTEFIGIMEEFDASGALIATDRKSVFVN